MQKIRYIFWRDGKAWLGLLEAFPEYATQGQSPSDLEAHLRDLHKELTSGVVPSIRKVGEFQIP